MSQEDKQGKTYYYVDKDDNVYGDLEEDREELYRQIKRLKRTCLLLGGLLLVLSLVLVTKLIITLLFIAIPVYLTIGYFTILPNYKREHKLEDFTSFSDKAISQWKEHFPKLSKLALKRFITQLKKLIN